MEAHELVDFSSDAAFAVDRELRVVSWNDRARELLGYSAEEVLGRSCWDVLRGVLPDGRPLCTPDCQAKLCFRCCRPYGIRECLGRHKDGRWVKLGLSSIAIPSGASSHRGITAVVFLRPLEEASAARRGRAAESPGAPLRAFTLGRFGLVVEGRGVPVERWARKQAVTLFKMLLTHRGCAVPRERLMEALWPGIAPASGRERLKVTVYALRKELRAAGADPDLIRTQNGSYLLRREGIWVDADVFEARVREGQALEGHGRPEEALRCYQEADALYQGDFLEEDRYEDWWAEERERLREIYLDTLGRMARLHAAQGDYPQAIQLCRKALVREPCRESVHRALMEYLWRAGRRDEALAQFDRLTSLLARELGVDPLPETRRLYERILRSPAPSLPSS